MSTEYEWWFESENVEIFSKIFQRVEKYLPFTKFIEMFSNVACQSGNWIFCARRIFWFIRNFSTLASVVIISSDIIAAERKNGAEDGRIAVQSKMFIVNNTMSFLRIGEKACTLITVTNFNGHCASSNDRLCLWPTSNQITSAIRVVHLRFVSPLSGPMLGYSSFDNSDQFGEIGIVLNRFGQIRTNLEKLGQFKTNVDRFGQTWVKSKKYEENSEKLQNLRTNSTDFN